MILLCVVAVVIFSNDEEGNSPRRSTDRPSEKPTVRIVVTAEQLYALYENNEVKADQLCKGKFFRVTGTVSSIGKDILDTPYVALDAGDSVSIFHVQCFFDKKDEAKLARLSPGDEVRIAGTGGGKLMNVFVRDCWFY